MREERGERREERGERREERGERFITRVSSKKDRLHCQLALLCAVFVRVHARELRMSYSLPRATKQGEATCGTRWTRCIYVSMYRLSACA